MRTQQSRTELRAYSMPYFPLSLEYRVGAGGTPVHPLIRIQLHSPSLMSDETEGPIEVRTGSARTAASMVSVDILQLPTVALLPACVCGVVPGSTSPQRRDGHTHLASSASQII